MSEDVLHSDEQSHYEISLTAGQAFSAFVLLLLSLAASFAFGLLIGRGQADERLVVRKEPAVINEGSVVATKKNDSRLVDLGVSGDDFKAPATTSSAAPIMETAPPAATTSSAAAPAVITEESPAPLGAAATAPSTEMPPPAGETQKPAAPKPAASKPAEAPKPAPAVKPAAAPSGPAYAQLLVTSDQKTADDLAAKVIDHGFMSAYVERVATDKGTAFKVRVKFTSEAAAKAAEPKLKELSKDVWITR